MKRVVEGIYRIDEEIYYYYDNQKWELFELMCALRGTKINEKTLLLTDIFCEVT